MARQPDPVRITTATRSHGEDLAQRQRRYLISMTLRTVCFLLAILSMGHWWLWLFVAGSVFLPAIAVVIANSRGEPDPGGPDYFSPDLSTRAIGGSPQG